MGSVMVQLQISIIFFFLCILSFGNDTLIPLILHTKKLHIIMNLCFSYASKVLSIAFSIMSLITEAFLLQLGADQFSLLFFVNSAWRWTNIQGPTVVSKESK